MKLKNQFGAFVTNNDGGSMFTYTPTYSGTHYLDAGTSDDWYGFYDNKNAGYILSAQQLSGATPPVLPTPPVPITSEPTPVFPVNVGPGGTYVPGDGNTVGSNNNDSYNHQEINYLITGLQKEGTDASEEIRGGTGETDNRDAINGNGGDDVITGARGLDRLHGGEGDDIVKAGNGADVITGGVGSDDIYGGFGKNTFTGEKDGAVDNLYLKSDHLAYNYLYDQAGNNAGNAKADEIESLDSFDKIHIQGAMDYELTVMQTTQPRANGTALEGIGIFASGSLEAVYTGGNLTVQQVQNMTIGVAA